MMKTLRGKVTSGHNVAEENLAPIMGLIDRRTGFARLHPGTLNVQLDESYLAREDAFISAEEYGGLESIKLQHCRVRLPSGLEVPGLIIAHQDTNALVVRVSNVWKSWRRFICATNSIFMTATGSKSTREIDERMSELYVQVTEGSHGS